MSNEGRGAFDLPCVDVVGLATDYLEGALSDEDRARVEDHLAMCEGCAVFLEQMRTTIRLTGRLTEETIPPPVREVLIEAFRARLRG